MVLMTKLRLGQVDYINCMPVYQAIEERQLPLKAELIKGLPVQLNKLFLAGELDITPISSIEYARHADQCYILPNLSISADGEVGSIFLFSRLPVTELEGKLIALTSSSATAVTLLKILFEHYYHVAAEYITVEPGFEHLPANADALLLIGDAAMLANQQIKNEKLLDIITDLGAAWKQFTNKKMVYAIWVVRRQFADAHPAQVTAIAETLYQSKLWGLKNLPALIEIAGRKTELPQNILVEYFKTIEYGFDPEHQRALRTFYDYAYKSGLLEDRVRLNIWSGKID